MRSDLTTDSSRIIAMNALQGYAAAAGILTLAGFCAAPLAGQSTGSGALPFLVQDGLRHVEQRRYSDAINSLEEAWERDPSNPVVAEHLALAYLYERVPPTSETLTKAAELMKFSLENDGQVSFSARHMHGGLNKFVGVDNHCSGRLILDPSGVQYRATLSKHSFSLNSNELQSIVHPKSKQQISTGAFLLRTRDGKRHRFRSGTRTRGEAGIVLRLTREFLLGG